MADFPLGAPKSLWMVNVARKLKRCLILGRKAVTPRQSIKKQRHNLPTKVLRVKAMFFSSSPVWTDVRVES